MMNKLKTVSEKLTNTLQLISPILLWLMGSYFAYVFIKNGLRKFDPEGMWTPAFENWGFSVSFLYLIGVLETLGGLFMLIPRIRIWGALTLSIVMIGALITRIIHGTGWADASYILFISVSCLYLASCHKIPATE